MKHSTEQLKDIVITAVEGGTNYWAQSSGYKPNEGKVTLWEMDEEGKPVNVHKVDLSVIRKGLKIALESEYEHIRIIAVTDILDAEEADVVVQLGLFGEVVYG